MSRILAGLPARTQVSLLRPLVVDALKDYGIADAKLSLIHHGFNTTFRVRTGRDSYALRVNMNSVHDENGVLAEVQWLAHLTAHGFPVPTPVARLDGQLVSHIYLAAADKNLTLVLYSWLPGSLLEVDPTPAKWDQVGQTMARLHVLSKDFAPTNPAALPMIDNGLMSSRFRIGDSTHPTITDRLRTLSLEVVRLANAALRSYGQSHGLQPIHGDLHEGNIMSNRGKISFFDFDDSGIGPRLQDLAITSFYIRSEPGFEDALRAGYSRVAEIPEHEPSGFESILAARTVLLLNELLVTQNTEDYALIPEYSKKVMWRVENFLATGRFQLAPKA